jgi:hypothetical protein
MQRRNVVVKVTSLNRHLPSVKKLWTWRHGITWPVDGNRVREGRW